MYFLNDFNEDIPEEFYSSETQLPFDECSSCGNSFGEEYFFIEKAFQRTYDLSQHELTFEYAICQRCKTDMMQSISKESMQNIQQFAQSMGVNIQQKNASEVEIDTKYMLQHCISTGENKENLKEYHLVGIFKQGKLVQLPMLYGPMFIEQYTELLSEETQDFFDDFFNHITILPPALAKILDEEKSKRPVFI